MRKALISAGAAVALGVAATANANVLLTFDNATDYSSNFDAIVGSGTVSGGVANLTPNSSGMFSTLYDTTPGDVGTPTQVSTLFSAASDPITVSYHFTIKQGSLTGAGQYGVGVGVYFAKAGVPSNLSDGSAGGITTNQGLLALYTANRNKAGYDSDRAFATARLDYNNGVNGVVTGQDYNLGTSLATNDGTGVYSLSGTITAVYTYSPTDTTVKLTIARDSDGAAYSQVLDFGAPGTAGNSMQVGVAVRGFSTATIDDFSVAVPEPASLGLLGAGALAMLARRRSASR